MFDVRNKQNTETYFMYKMLNYFITAAVMLCGPGSSVGIATDYGLDGPGIVSGFGGLGVCVLASGTQDRGFAPDRRRRIFQNGKIHSTQSFSLSSNTRTTPDKQSTRHEQNRAKKNPGGDKVFRTRPDRPWNTPSLLYNGYRVFPGGKAAGA
jgi:hypothetical protein